MHLVYRFCLCTARKVLGVVHFALFFLVFASVCVILSLFGVIWGLFFSPPLHNLSRLLVDVLWTLGLVS